MTFEANVEVIGCQTGAVVRVFVLVKFGAYAAHFQQRYYQALPRLVFLTRQGAQATPARLTDG